MLDRLREWRLGGRWLGPQQRVGRRAPCARRVDAGRTPSPPPDDYTLRRIESLIDSAALRAAVAVELSSAKEADQAVIQLRVIDQLSFKVVASELDISEGAARVRCHRALQRLQDRLDLRREANVGDPSLTNRTPDTNPKHDEVELLDEPHGPNDSGRISVSSGTSAPLVRRSAWIAAAAVSAG